MNPSSKPVIHSGKFEELKDRAGPGPPSRLANHSGEGEVERLKERAGINLSSRALFI